jgi:hypothetical protein
VKKVSYDKFQEPLVISKPIMEILLKQKKYSDLISLYLFYYYTAKWQRTDQARATTLYTAQGMNWTEERVRKAKKILIGLGLIEDITHRDETTQVILGHYIKVHFKWDFHTSDNPHYAKRQSVDNPTPNALENNNINALESNNINALDSENNKLFSSSISVAPKKGATVSDKNKEFLPIVNKLVDIITSKKRINVDGHKKSSWANSIRQLCERDGVEIERIEKAINWYERHHMDDYVPVIESGKSLREKFIKLEAAIERSKTTRRTRSNTSSGYSDREPLTYKKPRIV